jgi:hypothetical protein
MLRKKYSEEIEKQMKAFFDSLNEKDRRGYAAIEAMKLGHGGQNYNEIGIEIRMAHYPPYTSRYNPI